MSASNSNPNMVTIEWYTQDKRTKKGERLLSKDDWETNEELTREKLTEQCEYMRGPKERFEIHTTYVEKTNMMSQKPFWERYDTPYYCSPSSETYWSM